MPTTLITGAGSLARALAATRLAAGHRVLLADDNDRRLTSAARRLPDAVCWRSDLADPRDRVRLVEECESRYRDLDMVIHAADRRGDYHDLDDLVGAAGVAIEVGMNLTAPIDLSLRLLPLLLAQPAAAIVNVVSLPGSVPDDRAPVHAAARAGLDVFGASLGRRLAATGVRVHTVRRAGAERESKVAADATAAAILTAVNAGELDIAIG